MARVASSVSIGSAVSPVASRSTVKRVGPATVRATTRIRSAVVPSTTKHLRPLTVQPLSPSPLPSGTARAETMAGSQEPWSSATARVAVVRPAAMPGRWRAQASWSPEASRAWAASRTVAKKGAQNSARPISSRTTPSSTSPKPSPPYSSGIASPGRRSWSAAWEHTAGSKRGSLSMSLRTASSGDLASRNSRTDDRSSRSSLSSTVTTAPPWQRRSPVPWAGRGRVPRGCSS